MPETLSEHITKTPGTLGGKARIAGHRVRVLDIVFWHEKRGLSPDEILGLFPGITLADVHAALAYYFDHPDEIEEEVLQETHAAAAVQPLFRSKLREKLGD